MFLSVTTTMYPSCYSTQHVDHAVFVAGQQQDFISPQSDRPKLKSALKWSKDIGKEAEATDKRIQRRRGHEHGLKIRKSRCLETVDDEPARNPAAVHVTTARDSYGHHAHAYRPCHEAYEADSEREVCLQPFDHTHSAVPPLTRFSTQFDRYADCIMSDLVRFLSGLRTVDVVKLILRCFRQSTRSAIGAPIDVDAEAEDSLASLFVIEDDAWDCGDVEVSVATV